LGAVQAIDSPYSPGPGKYPRFESKQAEPGLSYGKAKDFPLPKTILFSVTPDELLADAGEWSRRGFNAFFLTGAAGDWSSDIWATDGEPWTIGTSDKTFQKVRQGTEICRGLGCEVFLSVSFNHPFDWFDDTAWPKIEGNFRQFARFAKETGCTGLAIDIEYISPQYHFNWPGYNYHSYTRRDLVAKIRARMTRIGEALFDEFPRMVLLTLPEGALTLGSDIQRAWIEVAARRHAPGGVHLCTEYTYRRPNIRYMFGHTWLLNQVFSSMLSERGRHYWKEKCSIAEGLWPFGVDPDDYHGAAPSTEEFRQAYAASLMASRCYNWIYSHDARPFMIGRDPQKYAGQEEFLDVISKKEIVTDPKFVQLAKDLRALVLRDYSTDLGLSVVTSFAGPREEGEIGLMPSPIITQSPLADMQSMLRKMALRIHGGEEIDFPKELGVQTRWKLIGPFADSGGNGFAVDFPPEKELNLEGEYDGVEGKVKWIDYSGDPKVASVDLTKVFQPSEQVCAYALCYVQTAKPCEMQIRLGANDTCKLWVGGELAFENSAEGRIILDKDIIPWSLPAGTTPILLKVCNNKKDWGFIFRITDREGRPVRKTSFGLK
jgi:hypothetical protein